MVWYILRITLNEISKPEAVRFRVFYCAIFQTQNSFPEIIYIFLITIKATCSVGVQSLMSRLEEMEFLLGAISRFPLYLFRHRFFKPAQKKDVAAIGANHNALQKTSQVSKTYEI